MAARNRKSGKASTKEKSWKPILDLKPGHNSVASYFTPDEVSSIWHASGLQLPLPVGLLGDLNEVRARYTVALHMQQKPTAQQLAHQTKRIAALCKKLLEALFIEDTLRSGLAAHGLWAMAANKSDPTGSVNLKNACDQIAALGRWSADMSRIEAARVGLERKKKKEADNWKKEPANGKDEASEEKTIVNDERAAGNDHEFANEVEIGTVSHKPKGNADKALVALFGELEEVFCCHSERIPSISRDSNTGLPGGSYFDFVVKTLQIIGLELSNEAVAMRVRRHGQMTIVKNAE